MTQTRSRRLNASTALMKMEVGPNDSDVSGQPHRQQIIPESAKRIVHNAMASTSGAPDVNCVRVISRIFLEAF